MESQTSELSSNRFTDADGDGIKSWSYEEMKLNSEKWSLAGDLGLLAHLKEYSNNLLDKYENAQKSMNDLAYDTKIRCVKVNNVINDFQMLAHTQFVESRVYDEEMDDIVSNSNDEPIEVSQNVRPKNTEIVTKIKSSLTLGLSFLNERYADVSQHVPTVESDEEEDIINHLIARPSKDEFSDHPLPFLIGSDDYMRDNFVGLGFDDENQIIYLENDKRDDQMMDDDNYDEYNSNSNSSSGVIPPPPPLPSGILNPIKNEIKTFDDEIESDDSDGGLFESVTKKTDLMRNNFDDNRSEYDSEISEKVSNDESTKIVEPIKPTLSFHDELSAALTGKKITKESDTPNDATVNRPKEFLRTLPEPESQKSIKTVQRNENLNVSFPIHSQSSDEDDDPIFTSNRSKNTSQRKSTVSSNIFHDSVTKDSIFKEESKPKAIPNVKKPEITVKNIRKTDHSSLFDNDDDDDDDLFSIKNHPNKSNVLKKSIDNPLNFDSDSKTIKQTNEFNKPKGDAPSKINKSLSSKLFENDEDDDDDFLNILSKPNKKELPNKSINSVPSKEDFKPVKISDAPKHAAPLNVKRKDSKLFDDDDGEEDMFNIKDKSNLLNMPNDSASTLKSSDILKPAADAIVDTPVHSKLFNDNKSEDESDDTDTFGTTTKSIATNIFSNSIDDASPIEKGPIDTFDASKSAAPTISKPSQSKLFSDSNDDDDDLFSTVNKPIKPQLLENSKEPKTIVAKTTAPVNNSGKINKLFDDGSDDDDDLFSFKAKSKPNLSKKSDNDNPLNIKDQKPIDTTKTNASAKLVKPVNAKLFDDDEDDDFTFNSKIKPQNNTQTNKVITKVPEKSKNDPFSGNAKVKSLLFSNDDDGEDDDDLFSTITKSKEYKRVSPVESKNTQISQKENDNDDNDEHQPSSKTLITQKETIIKNKPSFLGELSNALKKKNGNMSIEESDDSSDEQNLFKTNNAQNSTRHVKKSQLFSDDGDDNEVNKSEKIVSPKQSISVESSDNDDDLTGNGITPLSNDSLKQRAKLGSTRNRRPPSRKRTKPVKLTPITDFKSKFSDDDPLNVKLSDDHTEA